MWDATPRSTRCNRSNFMLQKEVPGTPNKGCDTGGGADTLLKVDFQVASFLKSVNGRTLFSSSKVVVTKAIWAWVVAHGSGPPKVTGEPFQISCHHKQNSFSCFCHLLEAASNCFPYRLHRRSDLVSTKLRPHVRRKI